MIDSFKDKYSFLSNFFSSPIEHNGYRYQTVEHLFQSMKTDDVGKKNEIRLIWNPIRAKKLGREVELVDNWDDIKDGVMFMALLAKFRQHPHLKRALLRTNGVTLIEGNYWHDNYWGDCRCDSCKEIRGKNKLGKLLMDIRDKYTE